MPHLLRCMDTMGYIFPWLACCRDALGSPARPRWSGPLPGTEAIDRARRGCVTEWRAGTLISQPSTATLEPGSACPF